MKFDLHLHSEYSPDSLMQIPDMIDALKEKKFNGFALTDHNTIDGWDEAKKLAKKHGLTFIPAVELSANEGHILCYGIKKLPPVFVSAEEIIADVHKQGGVVVAAHPFDLHRPAIAKHMGLDFYKLMFDGLETNNGKSLIGSQEAYNAAFKCMYAMTGGSDAHSPEEIGNAYTHCAKDVVNAIKKKNTKGKGGFHWSSLRSMILRRVKGVPIRPKV